MIHIDESAPKDATNIINSSEEEVIKPLRTMRGDLADLLAKNTLTPEELKSVRIQLQEEARAYIAQGGDERYLEKLFPERKKEDLSALFSRVSTKKNNIDEDIDLFIQKTTADIIAEQIPKSRQKTEEIKQSLSTKKVSAPPEATVPEPLTIPLPPQPIPPVPMRVTPKISPPEQKKEREASPFLIPKQTSSFPFPQKEPSTNITKKKEKVFPEIKKPVVPEQIPSQVSDPLIAEEKDIARALAVFPEKERALADALQKLASERAGFEALLMPLRDEERILEDKENSLHIEEARVEGVGARRHLEEERWTIEDRHRVVEQKRWKIDQEIIRIQNNVNSLEIEKKKISSEKESLEERRKLLEKKKRARVAQSDYKRLEGELATFSSEKEPLEISWIELSEKRKASFNELGRVRGREEVLEETITESEVAEHKTQTPDELHIYESRRWKAEEERRILERKRWALEDSLRAFEDGMKKLKEKYQKILSRENDVKKGMEDLQKLINDVRQLS